MEPTIQSPLTPLPALQVWWQRLPRWVLAGLAGLTPALVAMLLITTQLHASLFDFVPNGWNDQIFYWHQIGTFKDVGFNGGYYSHQEQVPALSFFHFHAAGPAFPLLYGLPAKLTGWGPYTGILFNMVILAVGIWIFTVVAQLDRLQIMLLGLTVAILRVVQIYLPSIMQESAHHALGLLLAAAFYRLLTRERQPPAFVLGLFIGLLLIGLFRFSWLVLLLPFFLLAPKRLTLWRVLAAGIAFGILTVAVLLLFQQMTPPGNNSILTRVRTVSTDPVTGLQSLLTLALDNISNSFVTLKDGRRLDAMAWNGLQFIGVAAVALVGCLLRRPDVSRAGRYEMPFHLYNLLAIFGLALVFYLPSGYVRLLTPHLLLTLALLIAFRRYFLVGVFIATTLLMTGPFLREYQEELDVNFHVNQAEWEPERIAIAQYVVYQPDAPTPWCNTVLLPLNWVDYRATLIPSGIGFTFLPVMEFKQPPQSAYLWLPDTDYQRVKDRLHVEVLFTTSIGTMYRNLDSPCPLVSQ
ncbi:MAG TPA: hypothetical protein VHO69_06520 [Phototrophicaceae bacterium]|nr:hypothetical protein [Phototrophicaceae bacterium]